MTSEDKQRIGTNKEGKVVWPKLDILGKRYEQPVSTRNVADGQFIVVKSYPNAIVNKEIERLGIARIAPTKGKANETK